MFHFSFWMVSIVRAAMCGRALSWRNDTDVCALFSLVPDGCLYWAFGKCRVIFSIYCVTLCEEIHVRYTFKVPEDGGHNLPSKEHGFRFFWVSETLGDATALKNVCSRA